MGDDNASLGVNETFIRPGTRRSMGGIGRSVNVREMELL